MSGVRLAASVDDRTGQTYVPARRFAADGSLRPCRCSDISSRGVLRAYTSIGGQYYGLLDLDQDVRVQARLDGDTHEVGAVYEGQAGVDESSVKALSEVVFHHV